ncbi:inositol monophosphatase [Jannaschia sp. 2305UL9-9]|uniref:inositol monophosphatase family protein n=1 Tax=Jannaschia sp. 2305UL9-9 TaxID=3121638 RepID=UPI003529A11F
MQGSANLNVMIKAARKAGRGLNKDFGEIENLQISAKAPQDFAMRADRTAGETIREALIEARPTYGMLCDGAAEVEGQDPTRRWIVDPIDGTTNFLHGLPHWAVTIALEHKGQITSAVIYDPTKDELFWAEKGSGAWLDGRQRLRVAGRSALIEGTFATGLPTAGNRYLPAAIKDLAKLAPACTGVRQFGAAALDLAYVAAGRIDGYWNRGLSPWHWAAGSLLVREAGGIVEPIRPETQTLLEDGHLVSGSGAVFEKFAKIVRSSA